MNKFSKIKEQFPIFSNNKNLVYLDSTATTLKPRSVINKIVEYYEKYSANVFRGLYPISEKATEELENVRNEIANFINANPKEIIFTRNTTESINLVSKIIEPYLIKNSRIAVTISEHHSNFVCWQQLCQKKKLSLDIINIDQDFQINKTEIIKKITPETRILAFTFISNVLGIVNPVKEIIKTAKKINPRILTIVDSAQAIHSVNIDVKELGCDFLAFSSHKMFGPTGVGVLFGKKEILSLTEPFLYGGEMIKKVTIKETKFNELPYKYEAGTPAIGEIIGLGEAIRFIKEIGIKNIFHHENQLAIRAMCILKSELGQDIEIIGENLSSQKAGIIAFNLKNIHPHDVAEILGTKGICIRAGHHCAIPLHTFLKKIASCRISFSIYNNEDDIKELLKALKTVIQTFKIHK